MNVNYNKKLFYCSKSTFIKIFMYMYLIINVNVIQLNFGREEQMIIDLFNIIKLILVLILFTFLYNLTKVSNKKIYIVVQIFLFIIICFFTILISGDNDFVDLKNFISKFNNNFMKIDYYYELGSFYIVSKYAFNDKDRFIYLETIVMFIIINLIILGTRYNSNLFFKINLIYIVIVLLATGINIYKKDIKVKCIDLFKINFIVFVTFFMVSYIKKYFNINIESIIYLKECVLVTSFIILIKNYMERYYNFIFKETKESQAILDDINIRIKVNNYKLEESVKKIKERQKIYKNFLKYFSDPIVIINENFRILYSNKEFFNIIGEKDIKLVINKKLNKLINLSFNLEDIKGKEFQNKYITDIKDKSVKVKIIKLDNRYEKDKYILIFRDLSEERKIIKMKEKLENKMMKESLKKNFLSSIYHDLKTPVNIIYSATQLEEILIENKNIEKLESYNSISKENCITLTQLTNNLIDMSKIDYENIKATMELANIVEFIEDYLGNLTEYIKNNNINLVFDTEEEEVFIYFDKEMMMRIILNLVSNSFKFTKPGGKIEIVIKVKDEEVIIEFSDTGIGMSEEFIKKAFDKYETENSVPSKGFGIGLFVVYNLVKAQNGNIEVKSNLNKGTTFTIILNK